MALVASSAHTKEYGEMPYEYDDDDDFEEEYLDFLDDYDMAHPEDMITKGLSARQIRQRREAGKKRRRIGAAVAGAAAVGAVGAGAYGLRRAGAGSGMKAGGARVGRSVAGAGRSAGGAAAGAGRRVGGVAAGAGRRVGGVAAGAGRRVGGAAAGAGRRVGGRVMATRPATSVRTKVGNRMRQQQEGPGIEYGPAVPGRATQARIGARRAGNKVADAGRSAGRKASRVGGAAVDRAGGAAAGARRAAGAARKKASGAYYSRRPKQQSLF